MAELKNMVHTSITRMESKVGSMVKDILKELEVATRSNICQNYSLLDIRMGKLEQLFNSQGSKLQRDVSQMLLQFSRGNEARCETVATDAMVNLNEGPDGNAG
ncbi:hypothetical protein Sjap_002746 [Stephania japonica]|uniref:Uncharacterized protein n=1 Tax=Stephania japonica TaxID=461633 RepID=A0AAP0KMM9_9MAGN